MPQLDSILDFWSLWLGRWLCTVQFTQHLLQQAIILAFIYLAFLCCTQYYD